MPNNITYQIPLLRNCAYQIPTDGIPVKVAPQNGSDFSLEELYEIVGCKTIGIVRLRTGQILVIDEEGKFTGPNHGPKPPNEIATWLAFTVIGAGDFIAGTALLCRSNQIL